MSFEVEPSLSQSTSRRAIIRTGARLAYAAPLVAASMHVHGASASPVVSGGPCTPKNCTGLCGNVSDGCGGILICGPC